MTLYYFGSGIEDMISFIMVQPLETRISGLLDPRPEKGSLLKIQYLKLIDFFGRGPSK